MAFRRRQPSPDEKASTADAPQLVKSRLLPQLFAGLNDRAHISVLDLGAGSAATLSFFGQLETPAKITFADALDLTGQLRPATDDEPFDFSQTVQIWQSHLALQSGDQIDYLLMWDYLHYFEPSVIEALSSALQPYVHRESRGYGFGSLHSDKPIRGGVYAIGDEESVAITPDPAPLPFAHSQQVIADNFVCMQITRGTLLQEGHLELLFEA
ncbi:MAG: hypothetical protein GKR90_19200 [Pseudomonadales bacterium]|nr:hypothetical protein [Pseudomonadales bacterium]